MVESPPSQGGFRRVINKNPSKVLNF